MKFVIDTLGGDKGSLEIIAGIKLFHQEFPEVELIAVGKVDELSELSNIAKIVEANDVMPMDAGVLEAMRMKNSSMSVAIDTLIKEKADGIISSGSTGAFLSLATLKIKKIPGVIRPALITSFPTIIDGKNVVLLDVGASVENTKEELVQFAKMGALYDKAVFGVQEPQIYLASNGSEEHKGSNVGKEAYQLLKNEKNFVGNMEARDVLKGHADVVVFDGYSGNIFLKGSEGMAKMMSQLMKDAFKKNIITKIGYLFAKSGINDLRNKMDYKKVGGALLIGVNAVVIKAHGNSDCGSFYSAMKVGYHLMEKKVVDEIKEGFTLHE